MTIDIVNENDVTITYGVLLMYEVDALSYIALIPVDEDEDPLDADIAIFEYIGDEDDMELYEIEDESEYETAIAAFNQIIDSI